jgi:hypothetical protein
MFCPNKSDAGVKEHQSEPHKIFIMMMILAEIYGYKY